MKHLYNTPVAELISFNYTENVVASGNCGHHDNGNHYGHNNGNNGNHYGNGNGHGHGHNHH